MRPIIGITSYADQVQWGVWNAPAALVPLKYVRAIEETGGRPLLVPPSDEGVEETLDALDGLVLSGGADIDPDVYGADPHPETRNPGPERDRAEQALLAGALARDLPVLAICRGMEMLNVVRGGDLIQHLPDLVGHEGHRVTRGVYSEHEVRLAAGSRIGVLLGSRTPVKSHHHQSPRSLGQGLEPVGWAEDGTVEAIEDPAKRFVLGVLWHPEEGDDRRLFGALVEEARACRSERRR